MKITKRKEHREITLDEFKAQKKMKMFEDLRTMGKNLNFLQIFAGSPRVFVTSALETNWNLDQIEEFIKDNHLESVYHRLKDRYTRDSDEMVKYLTVASYMRDQFFKLYPGLMERIEKNRAFAREHGYVRSHFGGKRLLIELMLEGEYDKREHGYRMNNLNNIATNTDIQNFESCVINPAMVQMDEWLERTGKKSYIWNCVHDSTDMVVHKDELVEVVQMFHEIFERDLPEMRGIPLPVDEDISDLLDGDYYKHGRTLTSFTKGYDEPRPEKTKSIPPGSHRAAKSINQSSS